MRGQPAADANGPTRAAEASVTDGDNRFEIQRARADYAERQARGADSALPGTSRSPQALESALASISDEITAEAIERKQREAGNPEPDRCRFIQAAITPQALAVAPPPISNGETAMDNEPAQDKAGDQARTLKQYGISHATQDIFYFGGYRYTNLNDAVAEAKRHPMEPAGN